MSRRGDMFTCSVNYAHCSVACIVDSLPIVMRFTHPAAILLLDNSSEVALPIIQRFEAPGRHIDGRNSRMGLHGRGYGMHMSELVKARTHEMIGTLRTPLHKPRERR